MRRPLLFVALAGLAAMLASVVVYSALKKREAEVHAALVKTVHVVVATHKLPLGTKIQPGQVKLARWSADAVPEGSFSDPQQVVGNFVKNQFVANEPIVAAKLFMGEKTAGVMPLLIAPGMRAVSVPVDEVSDIAGFVLPHTRVDILVALSGSGTEKPFSKIVLQNVEVLAVAQEVEQKKDQPELVKVVTVLVTPQDAERLALATREGTLRLAMRNYTDNKIVLTSGTDVPQMIHVYSAEPIPVMRAQVRRATPAVARPAPKIEVEILRNGKSSESISFVSQALAEPVNVHTAATPQTSAIRPKLSRHASDGASAANVANATTQPPGPVAVHPAPSATAASASFAPVPKTIEVP